MKKVVLCSFKPFGGRSYAYFTDIEDLQPEDLVVVEANTKYNPFPALVVRVTQVEDIPADQSALASAWVLNKVSKRNN